MKCALFILAGATLLLAAGMLWLWVGGGPLFQPSQPRDRPLPPWHAETIPKTVVAFGTSLTLGNDWPNRLQANLRRCLDPEITVIRVAAPGQDSSWALGAMEQVVALSPDLVLVEFAINDADLRDGLSLRDSRDQHSTLLELLRTDLPETRIMLLTMNPVYGLRGVLRPRLARYYQQTLDLAVEFGTGALDLETRWRQGPPSLRQALRKGDGLHPNDASTAGVIDAPLAAAIAQGTGNTCSIGSGLPG